MWGKTDRIEALLEEQNGLLRELLRAQGRTPLTPMAGVPKPPPKDASAVSRVTRMDVVNREQRARAERDAPWRSGPDSDPTPPGGGDLLGTVE